MHSFFFSLWSVIKDRHLLLLPVIIYSLQSAQAQELISSGLFNDNLLSIKAYGTAVSGQLTAALSGEAVNVESKLFRYQTAILRENPEKIIALKQPETDTPCFPAARTRKTATSEYEWKSQLICWPVRLTIVPTLNDSDESDDQLWLIGELVASSIAYHGLPVDFPDDQGIWGWSRAIKVYRHERYNTVHLVMAVTERRPEPERRFDGSVDFWRFMAMVWEEDVMPLGIQSRPLMAGRYRPSSRTGGEGSSPSARLNKSPRLIAKHLQLVKARTEQQKTEGAKKSQSITSDNTTSRASKSKPKKNR